MTANLPATLTFESTTLDVIDIDHEVWLRGPQIGGALGYAPEKANDAIQKIYTRHADEFTDKMTRLVTLPTPGGEQTVRVFSLRGAHLIGMFARTGRAAAFRRWVLDVLDQYTAGLPKDATETLLPSEQQTLKEVAHKRVAALPAELHGRALAEIWSRLQNKFRVARYSQLPRHQLADAIAYVMTLELHCAPAAAAAPKPAPDARERISSRDLAAIQSVIAFIAHKMHYPGSWTQGLWRYLRTVLDNPAPSPFYVDQLPIIERTLGEVIALVIQLRDAEARAEEKALRHLLGRHPQPLAVTLAELAAEVDAELSRARELKLDPPPYARLHLEAITDRIRPILRSLVMGGAERAAVAA